ncbi:hypothetical protein [Lachnoclostridium sp.]|uniref:hypothetical protein n=1 Tax=Lachnoclostridium sp. TaxID=2028282 RepID=UPI00289BDBA7|nr:hypothetical protein [Lachnoclostridium sp.]
MLSFRKSSRVIIIAAVVLVTVLLAGFTMSKVNNKDNRDENKLLTSLGYTKKLVSDVINNRTSFGVNSEQISQLVESLPLLAYQKYISFSLEPDNEINIVYEFDYNNYNRGGNGLDTFPESVKENNALLLFSAMKGLKKVNMLLYDDLHKLSSVNSFTIDDLHKRFGQISPFDISCAELYDLLAANLQLSEFYFAHYSRIYLGANFEDVSYRNGEPDKILKQSDGSVIWIYGELGKSYKLFPPDNWIIDNPGHTVIYYFNNPIAEKNDNLSGLYATMFYTDNGESYKDLTAYLGLPTTIKDLGNGSTYIAYLLREGQQRNAYFILHDNKVIAQGVMYGNDYTTLEFEEIPNDL